MKRVKAFILQQFGRKNLRKQESYEHKKEGFVNTFLFFSPNASIFNSNVLRGHEALPSTLEHHSRLVRTRLGHYYLCVPKPLDIRGESQAPPEQKHAAIVLDPGVRTFMTGYDADGAVYRVGRSRYGPNLQALPYIGRSTKSLEWSGGAASPALSHEGGSAPASA